MIAQKLRPLGYQQLSSISAATALTVPAGANCALFSAETQAVRWRDDGSAPTAVVGMPIPVNLGPFLYSGQLTAVQVIAETSGAVLNVSYYVIAG